MVDVRGEHSQVGTIAFDDRALRLDLEDQHVAVLLGTRIVLGRAKSDAPCLVGVIPKAQPLGVCRLAFDRGEHRVEVGGAVTMTGSGWERVSQE